MNQQQLRDEIKLRVTGGVLELEISDETIDMYINSSLRELQRYISTTKLLTIPYSQCIDLSTVNDPATEKPIKVSSVVRVYRTNGYYYGNEGDTYSDPRAYALWSMGGGIQNMCCLNNFVNNFVAYNEMLQIRNTMSTDLRMDYDKQSNKLYINTTIGTPTNITIEYIPRFDTVEEITADFWIDILARLSVANVKQALGTIRTRYVESGALWTQDGEKMRDEGTEELKEIREFLTQNTRNNLCVVD